MKNCAADSGFSTLIELLRQRATEEPDRLAFAFLSDGTTEIGRLTYQDLDRKARAIAVSLREMNMPSERALLLFQPGLDFVAAFFGCLYSGVVPIPAPLPKLNGKSPRLEAIVSDAQPGILLSTASLISTRIQRRQENSPWTGLRLLASDDLPDDQALEWRAPKITRDSLAFLQYTSGSTTTPKAVMVSHRNLLRNSEYIKQSFELNEATVSVTWLPNYHDMGLIDGIVQPIYSAFPAFLMSPVSFLQKPIRWLRAISDYRASHSGGPNFAYSLCANKTTPQEREGLDLTCWRTAYNGAEPIHAGTLKRFVEIFGPYGFRSQFLYPCYGLAEATLMVTGGSVHDEPITCVVQSAELRRLRAIEAYLPFEHATELVGCGRAGFESNVVIVDPDSRAVCPPGQVGEIWVSGPGVAMGYWRRPEETAATFRATIADTGEGPFLRTGDLGFLRDGELFVVGRLKDIVIVRGQNYYPQDIEATVENSHPALKHGGVAAFAVMAGDSERLVIVQEVERKHLRNMDTAEVFADIRRAVAEQHELQAYGIVLLRPGGIPKTSSGKIQRQACRSMFFAGTLAEVDKSVLRLVEQSEAKIPTREELLAFAAPARKLWLADYLRQTVSETLGVLLSESDLRQSPMELGMDSLTAVGLRHRLETELDVAVSPVELLRETSFETLVDRLLARLEDSLSNRQRLTSPDSKQTEVFPLSPGQEALWFLYRMAPENTAYNVSFAARIVSDLNEDALRGAFQVLSDRHSALRTNFMTIAGQPVQRVHRQMKLDFHVSDASDRSDENFRWLLQDDSKRPFDLEIDRLMRVRLYRRGPHHVLLLVAHHIVVDFWSLVILLNEFCTAYGALAAGLPVRLPPQDCQFADYVRRQSEKLTGEAGELLAKYWQDQLASAPTKLELPVGNPGSFAAGTRSTQRYYWDEKFTGQLKKLAKSQEVTLYMLLLAAFQTLLYRYSGQEDFLVGTSVAGRNQSQFAGLVGYFANQLVLRSRLSGNTRFSSLLEQTKQTVLGALAHQEYPFSLLVERLQPVRDLNHSPLVQVMFVLEKPQHFPELASFMSRGSGASMDLGELTLEYLDLDQGRTQFDLSVMLIPGDESVCVSWDYNPELFDAGTIRRMSGHFENLLKAIAEDPSQRIATFPLLSTTEREQLLLTWNQTEEAYPEEKSIRQLFEEQVRRSPDAIAATDGARSLDYCELNRRANQLAHHLLGLGVGVEVLVGICLPRSLGMLVALLGVLKAGAAYVPLDPLGPQPRVSYMLEDAQVAVLITQEDLVANLPLDRPPTVCLDSDWEIISRNSNQDPESSATADNLAYVIFTSGSTGKPKGTAITQRGLLNYVIWAIRTYEVANGSGAPVNSSLSFDATVTSLFCPLLAGKKVVLVPENQETVALRGALCSEEEFSLVKITPAQLDLLKSSWPSDQNRAHSRSFVIGGEPLRASSLTFWRAHASSTRLINEYGPTEAVVGCCWYELKALPTRPSDAVPIGRPIANVQIYLLDDHLEPVPIGVVGEIYIGGVGLARGYIGLSSLTAEKFVPDPFGAVPGARLYKTGDLARYLADGVIEFVGRRDDQVKIRGFRVELDEIRAVLLEHPFVKESAIKIVHGEFDKQLVAYFVPHAAWENTRTSELRRWVVERLPRYMVPSAFVALKVLPLTPNGKVDRQALPEPPPLRPDLDVAYASPADDLESLIASIWRDLLSLDKVGIHDSFFELGGHSLLVAQVHHRLQHALMQEIPITELLEHHTIHSLARYLRQKGDLPDFDLVHERARKQKRAMTFQKKLMQGRRDRHR
jgi:amino acid adenylation domain-containing protein